jgi:replicative DNA helicase
VSIAEIAPRSSEEFERTPPHDIAAEQCVLGGMLLSKDAISDVLEVIKGPDYYRPAHQIVHEVILDLYGRGEPADAVTVAAELTRQGDIGRMGGAPYLHTLIASVPTAANAGYYARIVRERAILRRLVEVGTRIVQLGYSGDGDADDLVDRAEAEVYGVTDRRVSEDYAPLSEIMPGALDEIEAIGSRAGGLTGVPTGFADLDGLTNGLHPGQMIVIAARPAIGKALALDTPLPTPTGWTTMGDVQVGDQLLGADGQPTRVVAATEVMTDRPCYEVEFDDGAVIVADAEHQWRITTNRDVVTTAQLAATPDPAAGGVSRQAVAVAGPADFAARDLSFPPYALGAWLGAGVSRSAELAIADAEIVLEIEAEGLQLTELRESQSQYSLRLAGLETTETVLADLGVWGARRIPAEYLRASQAQRRAVLAGLLDVQGQVAADGTVQLAVASHRLAADALELVLSLGYRATMTTEQVPDGNADSSTYYTITFAPADKVFRLTRKLAGQDTGTRSAAQFRVIVDVRPLDSVCVRCVQVDNVDHMYLAGPTWIPTHNSTLALDFARAAAVHAGLTTVVFSLEMSRNEITMRLLSAEARVALHSMRTGQLSDDDWSRLARRMSEVADAPLFIDDSPNMSMMEIRAKCRRLKQRNDLKLVIIDYLQLMSSPKRVENRQQEVSELSRSLKLLAKELGVPVIALSQLNRGPEQRTDKRPMLSDLRESGCMTATTRIMRADTNEEVTFGELLAAGATDIPVWALDERLKYVQATMTHVFPTGRREVFRLRLASGRQVEATMNHRFLTLDGWHPLAALAPGSRIASQRLAHHPLAPENWPAERLTLLAHLLGDGSFLRRRQPLRYASVDEPNLIAVTEAARHFGVLVRRDEYPAARVTTLRLSARFAPARGRRNPIVQWLDELGLYDLRSHQKFVPGGIFRLPDDQLALFLRHLWATDGSVTVNRNGRSGRIYYGSTSRRLIDDVASLLRRFGINGRVRTVTPGPHRPQYTVDVSGREEQLLFLRMIGGFGPRAASCARLLEILEAGSSNTNIDTIPAQVWTRVRDVLAEKSITHRQFAAAMGTQSCGSTMWRHSPSRARLTRVAEALDDADLEMLATNDVIWDTIVSVEPLGEQDVYDATVIGLHNFVANGIAAHNSIEQDADMVILLHREDAYERESPRAGEADFIVAKHRNGPTTTVTVAFQGHYSRFIDMAPI